MVRETSFRLKCPLLCSHLATSYWEWLLIREKWNERSLRNEEGKTRGKRPVKQEGRFNAAPQPPLSGHRGEQLSAVPLPRQLLFPTTSCLSHYLLSLWLTFHKHSTSVYLFGPTISLGGANSNSLALKEIRKSESHSVVSNSLWPCGLSLPGSFVHGIIQASILEWVAISSIQEIFPIQGLNWDLLHCRGIL